MAYPLSLDLWLALTVSTLKRTTFLQAVSGTKLGRVTLFDRLLDFLIAAVAIGVAFKILNIENINSSIDSLVGASGVSALAVSFATKDLGQAVIRGFAMQNWDAFKVGDQVKFGDGTQGTIKVIGIIETEIMGSDNVVTRIPNSELSHRVSNLSQAQHSQVKQNLRFKYSDLDRMPAVLEEIMAEIRFSCPKLIDDGSKPFFAVLDTYEPDHVQAMVNCHFDIPLFSTEYLLNQQEVVLAIHRAVKRHGVECALPSIDYKANGVGVFAP
jgi:small-conductance mechanosensitive channel